MLKGLELVIYTLKIFVKVTDTVTKIILQEAGLMNHNSIFLLSNYASILLIQKSLYKNICVYTNRNVIHGLIIRRF
jgi:hypothetical protein